MIEKKLFVCTQGSRERWRNMRKWVRVDCVAYEEKERARECVCVRMCENIR